MTRTRSPENAAAPARRRPRVTLVDVARAAGVSPSTVSLVLRNSPTIPARTRQRVQRAGERLGYVYNRGAASLRATQSGIVGVVANDLTNPFYAEIAAAIEHHLAEAGRTVLLANTNDSLTRQDAFVAKAREYNADGLVVTPAVDTPPEFIRRMRRWHMPVVLVARTVPGIEVDFVAAAYRDGMLQATTHLLALGHRRIAVVGLPERTTTAKERLDGYREGLTHAGVPFDPSLVLACAATREGGMAAVNVLLAGARRPTAAICYNDIVAFGVLLGLRARNVEPGAGFSVVGFDDVAEASLWRPALTTVSVSRQEIGAAATRLLLRRISHPNAPAETVRPPAVLTVRATTVPR